MSALPPISRLALALCLPSTLVLGATPTETVPTKIVGTQLIAGSNFGEAVDVDGPVMAVGAPDHYVPADARGAVYLFVRSGQTWSEHSRLFASDGLPGDEFGAAVALYGDTLLVGAPSRNGPSGTFEGGAYVFERTPSGVWTQRVKLLPPGVGSPDRFGERVALWGDVAAVLSSGNGSSGFRVFPFRRSESAQWVQETPLNPPIAAQDVALVGATLIVTGTRPDGTVQAAVYQRSGASWTLVTLLSGGGTGFASGQGFDGHTIALSRGSFLAPPDLRAYRQDPPGGWVEEPVVEPAVGDQATLGAAMAVHGDRLAVGLLNDPTDDFDSVLLLARDGQGTWQADVRLVPPDYPRDNGFGGALSTDGVTLAIGALEDGSSAGAVFVKQIGLPGPGEVPPSLTVSREPGGELTLAWSPSCAPGVTDYEVYEGQLGSFSSHAPLSCTTGGATSKTFVPSGADAYYLVVPRTSTLEGSFGRTSGGSERSPGPSACLTQDVASCM